MASFELVPQDGEPESGGAPASDTGTPGATAPAPTLRDRAVARWRRLSPRGRVAVAAGAAAVLLAATSVAVGPSLLATRADRLRAEAVSGLAGTVADLSDPLQETWEVRNGAGIQAVFPGGVVVTTDGADARAVDVATGDDVWRRFVGTDPECGPRPDAVELARPVAVVVCLGGDPDARTVTVLDASGTVVGERVVGPAVTDPHAPGVDGTAPIVAPAAGGALAVVDRTGETETVWTTEDDLDETLHTLHERRWADPTLRLEDAATGELRAEVPARLGLGGLEGCDRTTWTDEDGVTRVGLSAGSSVEATPSFSVLSTCGARVGVTTDGSPLDLAPSGAWLVPAADGGYQDQGEESRILAADGSLATTVPGWALRPDVDTDPGGPVLALTSADESSEALSVTAFGADGHEEWAVPVAGRPTVAARVAGTVVLQDGDRVAGLDAATGAELWARDGVLDAPDDGRGEWVAGALTDGTRVLLGVAGSRGGSHRLLALDARDGTTVWERPGDGHLNLLGAVDGHPVLLRSTLHGLG